MHDISIEILLLLIGLGFLAAFIDSVVGGGGLISIPALLLTGLPLPVVLGTNKLAASMSSLTSTISFIRSGKINFHLVKYLIPFSLLGAVLGSMTVRYVPTSFLKPLVIVLLIGVTLYTLFKKDWGSISTYKGITKKTRIFSVLTALVLGFYDGFFGAGTGSFLIFAFLFLGFDFVTAAGNAKALNFTSNVASLFTFIFFGSVSYIHGFIMGIAMIAGALVGSRIAIRKGTGYVRPLFIGVTMVLIGKQLWDIYQS
ncbi:TSUP family transporter [Brevibacillus dissolubilis]|uniref:TSUP family transporter n=1 Tax=Brevibacillus dissolubilis TaxID=1844116 RepID=UPI0011162F75|nr:TSUP family transporter [Brevibacillus dissolubilis]